MNARVKSQKTCQSLSSSKAISVTFQASMVSFQWGKRIEHHPALENKPHKPRMSSQEGRKISFWWQIAYGWRVQYCGSPFQNDLSNDSIRPSTLAPSFHPRVEPPNDHGIKRTALVLSHWRSKHRATILNGSDWRWPWINLEVLRGVHSNWLIVHTAAYLHT